MTALTSHKADALDAEITQTKKLFFLFSAPNIRIAGQIDLLTSGWQEE